MKVKINTLKRTGVAVALAAVALIGHAKDFRSSDVHPTDYPTVQAVTQMGKVLNEQTKGRLGVKVFANSAMGSEKDTVEQVKIGALDMVRINSAVLHAISPAMMVPSLPFLFRSTQHMRDTLDGPIGDQILASLEKEGFVGLAFYDSGSRSFYTTKKPIKAVADMKGMKIRVQQSEMWVAIMQALGANATPMPYAEVYTALKTGLVDGAENNWPSFESSRHYEAAKYYSRTEHSMAPEVLVFSKKVWDGLSKEDQQMIRKAAKESVPHMRKLWDEREAKARQVVTGGGAQINEVDKAGFSAAMKPVYDRFVTDPALKDLVVRIQNSAK
ncbi:TRAP transporter substrate-binding protein [Noviherbaspirillum saxi]|uniref:TRAP transporter substrate-binding protein n=1 Tax=Noviherbaspirillum saxi TaxID=2320863 RepID=A0A3A3FYM1_9BURK|nr:TRAP transporter substrate-binding protein [Noviherbaspirillum saxi]RJF92189.1 TRAP transporter substrate-binding protein [Noviherbaspirillum saxi]